MCDDYSPPSTEQGWAHTADARFAASCRGMFSQALRDDLIDRNPVRSVPEPRIEPRVFPSLSPSSIELLADSITPRYRLAVLLAAYAGLRIGEVGGLSVAALALDEPSLTVYEQVSSAGGKQYLGPPKTRASRRRVPLPPSLVVEVEQHMETFRPAADGRILTTPPTASCITVRCPSRSLVRANAST